MSAEDEIRLRVAEIQRFCMHDGPGVRTTVFLKGCPLRCAWCHNPEMRKFEKELLYFKNRCIGCRLCSSCKNGVHTFDNGHNIDRNRCTACGACPENCPTSALQICGGDMSIDEIIQKVKKDAAFYGGTGGVTLSGGEPFAQSGTFELLKRLKAEGINTAVETCGFYDVTAAVPFTDLFLWDIKDTDEGRHIKNTGASNKPVLENLMKADGAGAKTRLRCILVNGVNTDEKHYKSVAEIMKSLRNCMGADVLPYHAYGGSKAELIGNTDNTDKALIPTEEQTDRFKEILNM